MCELENLVDLPSKPRSNFDGNVKQSGEWLVVPLSNLKGSGRQIHVVHVGDQE